MAKQNFLAGGYYGKLGDTVGQRWKNIRTIRSYVIPKNPRTPLQQANRKSFGGVVPYAQLGNSANFGSPAFDLSVNTQWAYRMQQGTELQRGGEQGLNLIPLYPKNFIVPHIVSGVTITAITPNTSITFQISGNIPEEKKSYSIFLMFADGARENEIVLLNGETTDAQPTVFTCACSDTSEIDTATVYARVCSRDDERIETITASVQVLCDKDLSREFKPQFTIVEKSVATDGKVTFVLQTPNAYDTITSGDVTVSFGSGYYRALSKDGNTISGMLWGFDDNLQTVNHNGKLSFTFTATRENVQKEFVSAEMNWTIKLNFTNYQTSATEPITATTQAETQTTWQNTQPLFSMSLSNWETSVSSLGGLNISFKSTADLTEILETLNFQITPTSMQAQFKNKLPFNSSGISSTYETVPITDFGIIEKSFDKTTMKATLRYGYLADPQSINATKVVGATISWDSISGYSDDTLPNTVPAGTSSQYLDNMKQTALTKNELAAMKFKIDYASGHWVPKSSYTAWEANISIVDSNGVAGYACSRNGTGSLAAHANNLQFTIDGVDRTLTENNSNIQIKINAEMSGNTVGTITLKLTGYTSGTVTKATQAFTSPVQAASAYSTREKSALAITQMDGNYNWSFE